MSRKRRFYRPKAGELLRYQSCDHGTGWRVVGGITRAEGEQRVATGWMERKYDAFGRLTGYKLLEINAKQSIEVKRPTMRTDPTSITRSEMEANAGLRGRSRTMNLTEADRKTRVHHQSGRALPEEDFVERAANKIAAYPHSANFHSGDKAVRVYPRAAQ